MGKFSQKLLGMTINKYLTFKSHIKSLSKNVNQISKFLREPIFAGIYFCDFHVQELIFADF